MFRVYFFLDLSTISFCQLLTAVVERVYTYREGVRRCNKKHVKHYTIPSCFFFLQKSKTFSYSKQKGDMDYLQSTRHQGGKYINAKKGNAGQNQ